MWLGPGLETVPFHLIWVSLAIVYGLQAWPLRWAVTACVVVAVVTGIPLTSHAQDGVIAYEEVTEIPLMSVLFLVMVWHVRRRIAAVERAARSAEREHVAKRMQQRFVRLASHELRTPITVARGYAEMLREDSTDARIVEDATVVLDELSKLERISGRLLALAAAHDAQGTETVDVAALTHRVAKRWAPVAGRPVHAEVAPAMVVGDEERLETALDCLIENAITHTDSPSIVLRAYRHGAWAVLEVEDRGPGMQSWPASPLDDRSDAAGAQHGLGLTIVRGVVDAHGGELRFGGARSGGLRVTIRLPLAARALSLPV
ncbi:sensor histidine kinase [Rhizocola hellebori]|nr:HAMP domain-containing sensor histidine kinase [Rhizocola hellebori]